MFQTLSGAISDEGWSRFQFYADRVRAIASLLAPELMDPIHPSIWMFLAAKCRGSPLVPQLRDLLALNVRLSDSPGLILLMSPSLRTLGIYFALEQEEEDRQILPHVIRSLIETIPVMAPNLEQFRYDVDINFDHGYVEAFNQFARLKKLSITSLILDKGALQALFAIATLQDLSCSIDLSNSSGLALRPCIFQYLTKLRVAGSFDDLTAFLDACQLPSLMCISLSIKKPPRAREPVDSFAAIRRRCNPALLTSFRADINYSLPPPRPTCLMQYIEPILALLNIKSFYLSFLGVLPSIDDDDLARFGMAWPRLSDFGISHSSVRSLPTHEPQPMRPTLSGVSELARRCHHLETLHIPELDATSIPQQAATLPLGHALRSFWVNDVILPSPESPLYSEAAAVFDRVFPLMDLGEARSVIKLPGTGWKAFLGQLEALRLGRVSVVGGGGP